MKDHLRIGRWLAALAVVVGLLTVGGVPALADDISGDKNASDLTAGHSYTLTGPTTIYMDTDLSVKQISGSNYKLTIECKTKDKTGTLTVAPSNGAAIDVKGLDIKEAGLKILQDDNMYVSGVQSKGPIMISGSRTAVEIRVGGGSGLKTIGVNNAINIENADVKVWSNNGDAITASGRVITSGGNVSAASVTGYGIIATATVSLEKTSVTASGSVSGIRSEGDTTIKGSSASTVIIEATGATDYAINSNNGQVQISENAIVTASNGISAKDTITVVDSKTVAVSVNRPAINVVKGYSSKPLLISGSELELRSVNEYGIVSAGSDSNQIIINGSKLAIDSGKDSIFTRMSFDIADSTMKAVSTSGIGICAGFGADSITDSDITVSGKTYGILTDKDLILKNSRMKVTATGSGSSDTAIESQNGKIKYEKNDLFIKTPDNGRTKTNGGSGQIIKGKDEKPAKTVEFVKAVGLKEIRFEFPTFYDGELIDGDFKITSVPADALKSDTILETIKNAVKGSENIYYQESADGKTFKDPGSDKYVIDKYYKSNIPFVEATAISLAIGFDAEKNKNPIFDRNKVQFVASDMKVYVNGEEYKTSDVWVDVGKAVGSIKKAKIADIAAQEYTGKAITPEPAVTYNGKTLKKGTDYTLTYKSNTGDPKTKTTATVTVTGKGSYALSANKTFTIEHTKHVKGEGKVAKEPTTEAVGTREFCCTICGKVLETEEIAKLEAPSTADAPLSPENAISLKKAEKALKKVTGYKDPKTAKFGLLQAKAKKVGKNYVTLGWTKVKGAEYYVIYGNKCSKKNKYLKLTTAKASAKSKKIKKIAGKKLKKGTYYKFIIAAVAKDSKGVDKVIACSTSVHFITKGNAKYGDFTKVRLKSKKSVTIKVGKTHKIKATQVKPKNLKVQQHRKLSYESNNKAVATVSRKGKVKGISKGKAIIYVYAQNGIFAKVNVTVE